MKMNAKPLTMSELSRFANPKAKHSLNDLIVLLPRLHTMLVNLKKTKSTLTTKALTLPKHPILGFVAGKVAKRTKNSREDAAAMRDTIMFMLNVRDAKKHGLSVGALAGRMDAPIEAVRYNLKLLRTKRKVKMVGKRATAK